MAKTRYKKPTATLQPSFGQHTEAHLQRYAHAQTRELFYYLINFDEFSTVAARAHQWLQDHLQQAEAFLQAGPAPHLQSFEYTPESFAERLQLLWQQQLQVTSASNLNTACLHYVLQQYAPTALVDGCWLQNISSTAANHTEIVARLFHLYTQKIGDADTTQHHGNLYRDLLHSAHLELPEVNTQLFAGHTEITDHAFTAPTFQLALSLFPRACLPEILGFTLGHFFNAQDRLLLNTLTATSKTHHLDARYCVRLQLTEEPSAEATLIQTVITTYLADLSDVERTTHWQRIWRGFVVHHTLSVAWQADITTAMHSLQPPTLHDRMLAMVRSKAVPARNLHRKRKINGRLINDWFAEEPFDAEGFLHNLANSPYINRQSPAESRLLTRSIQFGGPMFRIFTAAEEQLMSDWAHSLADETVSTTTPHSYPVSKPQFALAEPESSATQADVKTYAKCNKRALYYYFVNADLYLDILPTAHRVAEQYFAQARAAMQKRSCPKNQRFFAYSHEALENHIQQIYQAETSSYQISTTATFPKEFVIWFIQQYALFPMVDGSWLQHAARAGASHTAISAYLFRIYSDEVGNSDTVMNHPNVYRRMLENAGINMPATDSWDFPHQPGLLDCAFNWPLLTMSVSFFPKAFLPEIIGINLAIELSGLGAMYMSFIDELNRWKLDPYFFTLHLTIDNIASGHTAMALKATHLYLEQVFATQGEAAMQREWEKVWVGYLAATQTMKKTDNALQRKGAMRYLLPLIQLSLANYRQKKLKGK